jgi:hypothetical protein
MTLMTKTQLLQHPAPWAIVIGYRADIEAQDKTKAETKNDGKQSNQSGNTAKT